MSFRTQAIDWSFRKSTKEFLAKAALEQIEYWVVTDRLSPVDIQSIIPPTTRSELLTFRDSSGIRHWSKLDRYLPTSDYFLAIRPSNHPAVVISAKSLASNANRLIESRSMDELVVRLSEFVTNSFVDGEHLVGNSTFQLPSLTMARRTPDELWLRERIQSLSPQNPNANAATSATNLTALKAGLFLLNEQFDDSHSCSQSIEGMGLNHTGDYWHAILHRREPDYGNAKYWFRHVGQHPIHALLAQVAVDRLREANDATATKLQRWKSRLIPSDCWEPFAFVDLCEAAEQDADLRAWCEQIQYDEMLLLLESSARDVFNVNLSSRF